MRAAASSPRSRMAAPPMRSTEGSLPRSTFAISSIVSDGTSGRGGTGRRGAGAPPSPQETSAGTMSVAMRPGGP